MEPPTRPTSVTVIAWIYIVGASLTMLSSLVALVVFNAMKQMGGVPTMPPEVPAAFKLLGVVFQHYDLLVLLQLAFAVFVLVAGIGFLKLRAWARTALEAVSWLSLVYLLGFGILWIAMWVGVTSRIPQGEGTPVSSAALFTTFGIVMATVILGVFAIPPIVIIKFLRGSTSRQAVAQQ